MNNTPIVKEINVSTGEVIERNMNADELAQFEADKISDKLAKSQAAAKEAARKALLDKLGITADEAALLLG